MQAVLVYLPVPVSRRDENSPRASTVHDISLVLLLGQEAGQIAKRYSQWESSRAQGQSQHDVPTTGTGREEERPCGGEERSGVLSFADPEVASGENEDADVEDEEERDKDHVGS